MSYQTIVLGAGAAGLAAARELAREGARVIVLEARDRVGGRVRWARIPGSDETAELGAEFIHGPAPETHALLLETGGRAETREGDEFVLENGRLVPDESDFLDGGKLFESVGQLREDETVDAYLARLQAEGHDPKALRMARTFVEGFDAADPARASVRGIAHEWLSGVDSTSGRPSHGYAPLIERLQADAIDNGAEIVLSARVASVHRENGGVAAITDDGTRYEARFAISTLPAGVLRSAQAPAFVPDLPSSKRDAIAQIETGPVARVVLLFRSAFWERVDGGRYRDAGFFRSLDGRFRAFWTQYPLRSRTIVAWAGGPRADDLLRVPQRELALQAVEEFGALLGDAQSAREEFETSFMHDWSRDPFAHGAYSYLLVGGEHARIELARPVDGVLFFAGEATMNDGQGGTVNGAIASGVRAAREVLGAFARSS